MSVKKKQKTQEHIGHESDRNRFVAFAFAAADILLELDKDNQIIYMDGATAGFLGTTPRKILGTPLKELIAADEQGKLTEALEQLRTKGRIHHHKLVISSNIYKSLPITLSGVHLKGVHSGTYLTITVRRDEMTQEQLTERDIKSGLLQKENYSRKASAAIAKTQESGKDANVTLLDFPELKEFLDSLDPETAATLTMEIADYLRSKSVDGDTAGLVDDGIYSFVHDASVKTEEIINEVRAITKRLDPKGKGIKATAQTVSPGTSALTEHDSANAILYTLNQFAKRPTGFTIDSIDDSYTEMLNDTMHKIAAFKETVDTDQFKLAFQPIVELKSGIIHHFETLVRFESETFDNPFQFITFGEQTDMIADFDLAMTQRTIQVLEEAAKKGYRPIVAINISGRSLSSQLFMDAISKLLENAKRFRKQIIFEVTESAKIDNMERANNFIQSLRKEGHQCCLDDFGVAESSFDYLRNLHIDYVKIDGSYVRDTLSTVRGRNMLKAMVGMCRNLDITTIGEMVEDEKTAAALWESGVHFGQGYLFGKPTMDTEELINCAKPTPFYGGIMRARRVAGSSDKKWWSKKD